MKHKAVWAKAIGDRAQRWNWFGGSAGSIWRVLLIAVVGGCLGMFFAHMNGFDVLRDTAVVSDYTTRFTLAFLVAVIVPAWAIRLATDLVPCSSKKLTAAYEDHTLRRWVRAYAVTQLRDDALARGADGWATIWEERRASL